MAHSLRECALMFVFVPQSYRDKKKGLWKCSRSGGPLAGPAQLAARMRRDSAEAHGQLTGPRRGRRGNGYVRVKQRPLQQRRAVKPVLVFDAASLSYRVQSPIDAGHLRASWLTPSLAIRSAPLT